MMYIHKRCHCNRVVDISLHGVATINELLMTLGVWLAKQILTTIVQIARIYTQNNCMILSPILHMHFRASSYSSPSDMMNISISPTGCFATFDSLCFGMGDLYCCIWLVERRHQCVWRVSTLSCRNIESSMHIMYLIIVLCCSYIAYMALVCCLLVIYRKLAKLNGDMA